MNKRADIGQTTSCYWRHLLGPFTLFMEFPYVLTFPANADIAPSVQGERYSRPLHLQAFPRIVTLYSLSLGPINKNKNNITLVCKLLAPSVGYELLCCNS